MRRSPWRTNTYWTAPGAWHFERELRSVWIGGDCQEDSAPLAGYAGRDMRILVTTTSFQDTPGAHHEVLRASGYDVVTARGPLTEAQLLALLEGQGFDGILNGDDAITARVIDAAMPRLRVIAKYGIGLDSIDVAHAVARSVPVLYTPGVNHTTVAEHTFGLMIALSKHFWSHLRSTKAGQWKRITGGELAGKQLALLGLGRIGKEVARRAVAFDMQVVGHDLEWDEAFARAHSIMRCADAEEAVRGADVISFHMNLGASNRRWLDATRIATLKRGALVINTARGGLVDEAAIARACASGALGGYATDVLDQEPPPADHPFTGIDNIIVTPHVGSRTFESVERQGLRAAKNIVNFLSGDPDFIRAH
jgi:D-3-phosphoglycerate dehydrogenase / 2-oxoglutarate reductase